MFIFDFDRTLTNGISSPGETNLSMLVRGGSSTITSLSRAQSLGCPLYIITARRPSALTVEQINASLDNAQSALSPFFLRGPATTLNHNEIPLARGGHIYAADYQKAAALAHIIGDYRPPPSIYFFDDVVVNSYIVATTTSKHLPPKHPPISLTSFWWDSFEEEAGPDPTMTPSHTATTDSNYADHARHMLAAFGVTASECDERIELYRSITKGSRSTRRAGEALKEDELARVKAASKEVRANMGPLESVLGARFARGPRPPPPSNDWRAKAAADKSRAAAAKALFRDRPVSSLPPGLLSDPRWETMFQVESPDEGTTGGLTFVATLSGAFAIKSANDLAEEYIGTHFLHAAGVPTPAVIMTFPGDEEHACILKAVEEVAKQYSRRGDAEGATSIMMHGLTSMRKFDGPLLLMELVPAASTLNQIGGRASIFLEPDMDPLSRTRLESIGRMWILDTVLNFRDRFTSRINYSEYDAAVVAAESEEDKVALTGNCDNVLISEGGVGIVAVDSHVKLIIGSDNSDARSRSLAMLLGSVSSLLADESSNPISFDWLRFTVEVVSGHSLSDSALEAARIGAIKGLFATSSAVSSARAEIEKGIANRNEKWTASLLRIDIEALSLVAKEVESKLGEHCEVCVPPQPLDVPAALEPNVGSTVEGIGASPLLWARLSDELKEALVNERVLGISPGPHSAGDFWYLEQGA
ncbi:hypothetical protein TrCOL_g1911 [Triparma columacea]|uniref:Actin-fragmin kinase catalytic domain-containing protein n=1 Tax=Triparma columacea TaxID=722753 RepID=A0A9W7L195_9STRA|nr:hypothetical protein TrCOL_g1911 [Triparma columacea]